MPLRNDSKIKLIRQKQNWDAEKQGIQVEINWEIKIFCQLQLALDHTQAYIWHLKRLSLAENLLSKKIIL